MKHYNIAITRQFGCGGSAIAARVAQLLGLPLFDRERLEQEAAQEDQSLRSLVDFSAHNISGIYKLSYPLGIGSALSQEKLFSLQSELILRHARKESCVFVGRCADYLLREEENILRIYIFAPYQARVRSSIALIGTSAADPQRVLEEVDRARAEYYRTRTGCEVNNTRYRDLFLNSATFGQEQTAQMIADAARAIFSDTPEGASR